MKHGISRKEMDLMLCLVVKKLKENKGLVESKSGALFGNESIRNCMFSSVTYSFLFLIS